MWGERGSVTPVFHNKAARIILDLPPRTSASETLEKLSWKKVDQRRAEHRAIFFYINVIITY